MKKNLKSLCILLTAGLALVACSSDDVLTEQDAQQQNKTWTATATVGKTADTPTRTLDLSDNTLNVGWATTEKIYVSKKASGVNVGYLSPTADTNSGTTTVTGTLDGTDYNVGEEINLMFPRQTEDYSGQDGTLATIATNYDYATATTTVASVSGSDITLTATTLTSRQAIVKFTFSDAVTDLAISSARLRESTITIKLASAQTEVFAALPLTDDEAASYLFTGFNSSTHKYYEATKTGVKMENGKYYTANVKFEEFDAVSTPLTFEAVESGRIMFTKNKLPIKYSKNGSELTEIGDDLYTVEFDVQTGDIIQFYGDNPSYYNSQGCFFKCDADCFVYGNFMSLISSTQFSTLKEFTTEIYSQGINNVYAFAGLFSVDGGRGTNPHILNHPYKDMALPATTLVDGCYAAMFMNCTNLTRAPELPATVLPGGCYIDMFRGCTNLNYVKCLATTLDTDATRNWLMDVAETGTIYINPSLELSTPATYGTELPAPWQWDDNHYIPSGWTVLK